jgi:hypothetical protein
MSGNCQTLRIDAKRRSVLRIAQVRKNGRCIIGDLTESKDTGAAPRTSIIEGDGVPAGPSNRLRKIEIFLIAGETVADDQCRMGSGGGSV